jgi:hypothetical protein
MEVIIPHWIFHNWQRKLIALLSAIVIWVLVDQSITSTKTLTGVLTKVINLPEGKTISGMSPDGTLNRRMSLVVSGKKNTIDNLESNDIEIILDATNVPDEWIVQIGKKNLVSLNPKIDLTRHINNVSHQELVVNLSNLITDKIPIKIRPKGNPPEGYRYLGVWPYDLVQTVSGPEEQVLALRAKGIKLTFDLNTITKEELETLSKVNPKDYEDEISFPMPEAWKKVLIPFLGNSLQVINDPLASELRLEFLHTEYIKIKTPLPLTIFIPLGENNSKLRSKNLKFDGSALINAESTPPIFIKPIFAYKVSRLFWDIVQKWTTLVITANHENSEIRLNWSPLFINPNHLEDEYVAYLRKRYEGNEMDESANERREMHWRYRFRDYLMNFTLYSSPGTKLKLNPILKDDSITFKEE